MSKLKAPHVWWIRKAWEIKEAIADVPVCKNLLALNFRHLSEEQVNAMESLQDLIAEHLAYGMSLQKGRVHPERGYRWGLTSRDASITREQWNYLADVVGMKFSSADNHAFAAHMVLGETLSWRCILEADRSELPLLVATISTPRSFVGKRTDARTVIPRNANHRSTLTREMEIAVQNHPAEKASELLVRLTGTVVESSDGDRVTYWASKGTLKTITRRSYEGVFTKANRAVASASAQGKRLRNSSSS